MTTLGSLPEGVQGLVSIEFAKFYIMKLDPSIQQLCASKFNEKKEPRIAFDLGNLFISKLQKIKNNKCINIKKNDNKK